MSKIVVMDHPLIQHKIGIIRRTETSSKEFREMIGEIAMLMCYEATRDLKLEDDCERTGRKETGCSTDSPCRPWNGRRYVGNDSGCKSRTYRSVP